MSDHYRNALQSIVSDYAHSKGNVDRTDAYAQTALDALNTPPPTALQADRAAPICVCGYVRDSLGCDSVCEAKPTDEAPAKGEPFDDELLRAGQMLSCVAFNLAQDKEIGQADRNTLDKARKDWDAAFNRCVITKRIPT